MIINWRKVCHSKGRRKIRNPLRGSRNENSKRTRMHGRISQFALVNLANAHRRLVRRVPWRNPSCELGQVDSFLK